MQGIVAFTGKMGAGKTTAADMLQGIYRNEASRVKFAGALYDIQDYIYTRTGLTLDGPKDRKLLQWLGTEWGREKDRNLWVNLAIRDAKAILAVDPYRLVILDDARFDNEAQAVLAAGGKVINVSASDATRGSRITLENTGHASEAGISPDLITHTINNNGSLYDLERDLRALIGGPYVGAY